jgi:uncharacterized membrane protein/Mg-chelatase subunit ChlD
MTPARVLSAIVPPARRPVTIASVLPLAAFVALFAGVVLYLELARRVAFTNWTPFLLALVLPWVWWQQQAGYSGLRGARAVVALMVRCCLIALFSMLLAGPRAVRTSDVLSVVYAVDRSDSIGEAASDSALKYVAKTASQKPEKDEAGLVVFGRDAAVELPPRTSLPLEGTVNSRVPTDGTNIEKALSLAAAVGPPQNAARIVLVSDGVQTEGNLSELLDELKARGIPVDVLPIHYDYPNEVWLERLDLPRFVKAGETYDASVVLSSLQAGRGRLVLRENGRTIYEGDVDYTAGKNRFELPLRLREPGYYEYTATIEPPAGMDGWPENNVAVNHIYLPGEGKVMLVTDPAGDPRDWQTLERTLRAARFVTERVDAFEFPRDPLSLMPYDCILFVNVPADAVDAVQMEGLRVAVHDLGVGFVMVGGANGFGAGGWHRTAVEKALPVTMDVSQKKILPKGALVIILHTCEFPEGNTWGKRVTKEAMRVLGSEDEVGALAYDYQSGEGWIFPLTPASQYERLVTLVNQAQIGDMPTFQGTMQLGLDALKKSDAATKHMIIISDGDPSPPTPQLLQDFVAAKVSVSTVTIFPHGGQDVTMMGQIAQVTGGRAYYPRSGAELPSIFIKEAKTLKRDMIQNVTFTPLRQAPSPILKGIDETPPLRGYVLTTARPTASVILKGPEKEQLDPVLATWRYGVGKSAAFTSDLSPNWAAQWVDWDRYLPFVRQLVTDVSRVANAGHLQVRAFASGGSGVIEVDDFAPEESFLEVQATVSGPREQSQSVRLKQTGPRSYEGRFDLWGRGRYQVAAAAEGEGRSEQTMGGFVVAYSPEYLRFRSDPAVLRRIAERTGGRVLTGQETGRDIFPADRPARSSSRPIDDLFLLLLACLVPLDVGVRRVQLDWALIRGWLGMARRKGPSGKTFEALLKRKRSIEFLSPDEERRIRAERGRAEKPAQPPPKKAQPPAEGPSTTARLLDMKRKWKKGDE